jgi:mycothiol synthase
VPDPHITAFEADELPALLSLCRETGCCRPDADLAWLQHRTLGDPTVAPDLMLAARVDGLVIGFGIACVRDALGVVKAFGVREGYRRRGIATRLLDELEARLAARGLTTAYAGGVGPNFISTGVSLRHTGAIALLMRRGYRTDRKARVDMLVDLDAAPLETGAQIARLAAQGLTMRRAQPGEVEAVAAFAAEQFEAAWQVEVLEGARSADPPALFVACEGASLVAFAAHSALGPAYFGPTGTLPAYRSRGIGGVLLRLCLQDIRAAGSPVTHIAWAGPVDYYARVAGARITDAFWCFEKELGSAN